MSSLLNLNIKGWESFFDKEVDLNKKLVVLERRRNLLKSKGINIWPSNSQLFDMFHTIKPEEIKLVIILPHPYNYDSRTTVLLNNLLGNHGVFLLNISLSEEEVHNQKLSHEIMWSKFNESLIKFISNQHPPKKIKFLFTGMAGIRCKSFVNNSNGFNEIYEVPAITSKDFVKKVEKIIFAKIKNEEIF